MTDTLFLWKNERKNKQLQPSHCAQVVLASTWLTYIRSFDLQFDLSDNKVIEDFCELISDLIYCLQSIEDMGSVDESITLAEGQAELSRQIA